MGSYANHALGADELDEAVGHAALGVALSIRLDVAEVTNVAVLVARGAVGLAVRVDCVKLLETAHTRGRIERARGI